MQRLLAGVTFEGGEQRGAFHGDAPRLRLPACPSSGQDARSGRSSAPCVIPLGPVGGAFAAVDPTLICINAPIENSAKPRSSSAPVHLGNLPDGSQGGGSLPFSSSRSPVARPCCSHLGPVGALSWWCYPPHAVDGCGARNGPFTCGAHGPRSAGCFPSARRHRRASPGVCDVSHAHGRSAGTACRPCRWKP
jgi:hypothetical protein